MTATAHRQISIFTSSDFNVCLSLGRLLSEKPAVGQREAKPKQTSKQTNGKKQCSTRSRIFTIFCAGFCLSIARFQTLCRRPDCHETKVNRKSVSWLTFSHIDYVNNMINAQSAPRESFTCKRRGVNTSFILYIFTTFEKLLKPLLSGVTKTPWQIHRTSPGTKYQLLGGSKGLPGMIISRILRNTESLGKCHVPPSTDK